MVYLNISLLAAVAVCASVSRYGFRVIILWVNFLKCILQAMSININISIKI